MNNALNHIISACICSVLLFGAGFYAGTKRAENKDAAKQIEYLEELRIKENNLRDDYDAIIKNLVEKQSAINFQSDIVNGSVDRLRDSVRKLQNNRPPACSDNTTEKLGELFTECAENYSKMAGNAERHAADAESAVKSWNAIRAGIMSGP